MPHRHRAPFAPVRERESTPSLPHPLPIPRQMPVVSDRAGSLQHKSARQAFSCRCQAAVPVIHNVNCAVFLLL